MKFSIFDFHCDTALRMLDDGGNPVRELRKNEGHIDLVRAAAFPGYAQCFACFTTPFMEQRGLSPDFMFQRELSNLRREVEKNKDRIAFAASPTEILENREKGIVSAILTLEGTAGIGFDPDRLPELWEQGFRVVSLGWNERNILTGSHVTGGGLTDRGAAFVKQAQDLGMLIDVSHISDEGFWDILKITRGPVIATHSNSRRVCNNSRNLTDDMFRAICETGGVAGYNACDEFTGEKPTLDTSCDHILHFLELDPTGGHVALGGDLDGISGMPEGFTGVESWPAFAERLLNRGLDAETVHNLTWNNAIGVMERAVCNHTRGS